VADFWREIGYPTPVSRVWEASRRSSPGELFSGCRSAAGSGAADCPATSVNSPPLASPRRGSCSSPTGVRLTRGPRMGPWRGPLPRRRVSPPPVIGTFIDRAFAASTASSSLAAAARPGSSSSVVFQELEVQTGAIIAVQTAVDPADRVGDVISVDHVDRGAACPLVHRYGLGHWVQRFRSLWAPSQARSSTAVASATPITSITPSLPPSSIPSAPSSSSPPFLSSLPPRSSSTSSSPRPSGSPFPRSFASVLGSVAGMAGQRPPLAGAPGTAPRPPAPAVPPQQATASRPLSAASPGAGQQGAGFPPFPQTFAAVPPRPMQPLQPPSRQPGPPAYMSYPHQPGFQSVQPSRHRRTSRRHSSMLRLITVRLVALTSKGRVCRCSHRLRRVLILLRKTRERRRRIRLMCRPRPLICRLFSHRLLLCRV
jgi:hypothetical protein